MGYTAPVSNEITKQLRDKGMPVKEDIYVEEDGFCDRYLVPPTYAEVFDWFMLGKNIAIILYRMTQNFRIALRKANNGVLLSSIWGGDYNDADADWEKAANAAIEKALTLI